jgi:chromosomal replication initiator protein
MAILRKKARTLKIKLRDEIFDFLATRIKTNVRRLEGALMRVASVRVVKRQGADARSG